MGFPYPCPRCALRLECRSLFPRSLELWVLPAPCPSFQLSPGHTGAAFL
uniref:Uncharacterized protein HMFN0128 n=1 Tax=Homo sapiens TaxID=9606 RepID=Q68CL7_HUMAN|nr:putative protein product of HMFN0128 [Homo sapiens]